MLKKSGDTKSLIQERESYCLLGEARGTEPERPHGKEIHLCCFKEPNIKQPGENCREVEFNFVQEQGMEELEVSD